MVDKKTLTILSPWSLGVLVVALLVLLPIASVMALALFPSENIWPHLMATVLPRYLTNSLVLAGAVGVLAGVIGTTCAWLVTMYRFPGSNWLGWALLLPLAIPAYVGAYALVDFLEYAGPVQTALRSAMGWTSARDYWFPEIRSVGAAIIVLAVGLYPYVFLIVRTALRESSASAFEVGRALGTSALGLFWRIGMPLARPAIAASVALVMMETISDFGVVSYFAVQTLTTGIFTSWLDGGNAGAAAQIASLVLLMVLVLVGLEKRSRKRLRFFQSPRDARPIRREQLTGVTACLAALACLVPLGLGFVLPVAVIFSHALANADRWIDPDLLSALWNTLMTGGVASMVTVLAALLLTYAVRFSGRQVPSTLLSATTIGYAAPGAVLGVGLLIPMAWLDHRIADLVEMVFGGPVGLVMTGTAFAVIYAYSVRFFAIAQGAVDAGIGRIPPSLSMAARSLGHGQGSVLWRVTLPMIRASVGTAMLLVFVDCVKELPATLLLRPFNFNTLSTRTYEKASLEQIGEAAPAAMLIILVGLCAVLLLAHANRERPRLRQGDETRKSHGVPL